MDPGNKTPLNITDFKLCDIPGKGYLGEGAFGKVYLAQLLSNDKFYAIKAIRKSMLIDYDIVEMTKLESYIMQTNDHPNLMKMEHCFQNTNILFFVMDFVQGGELRDFLTEKKTFDEEVVKFYAV